MAIDTGPSKKFMEKTTLKIKKKLPGGGKMKLKKTVMKPRASTGKKSFGNIRTDQKNPMPDRINANIGFGI